MYYFTRLCNRALRNAFLCKQTQFKINRHLGKSQISDLRCFLTSTSAVGGCQPVTDRAEVPCITMGLCMLGAYILLNLGGRPIGGEVSC